MTNGDDRAGERSADELEATMRAARDARVSITLLIECVERELVSPGTRWSLEDLETARRARRLSNLGLNMPGVEVAMHMRERMLELREQMRQMELDMIRIRREHEREIARLMRALAEQPPPGYGRQ